MKTNETPAPVIAHPDLDDLLAEIVKEARVMIESVMEIQTELNR